jgi:hypothetical protein
MVLMMMAERFIRDAPWLVGNAYWRAAKACRTEARKG